MRSRASSTSTETPFAISSFAAASPAPPAPMTSTSGAAVAAAKRARRMRRPARRRRGPAAIACDSTRDRAPPDPELGTITHPGMGRARGRQQAVLELARRRQRRRDVAAPGGFGLAAVEADAADRRVRRQEAAKSLTRMESSRIAESRLPGRTQLATTSQSAMRAALQRRRATRIGCVGREAADLAGDAPELVVPEGVVLARGERGLARHAAEDEDARARGRRSAGSP